MKSNNVFFLNEAACYVRTPPKCHWIVARPALSRRYLELAGCHSPFVLSKVTATSAADKNPRVWSIRLQPKLADLEPVEVPWTTPAARPLLARGFARSSRVVIAIILIIRTSRSLPVSLLFILDVTPFDDEPFSDFVKFDNRNRYRADYTPHWRRRALCLSVSLSLFPSVCL